MQVSLSEDMTDWVDTQAKAEGFPSESDYVRAVLQQRLGAIDRLRARFKKEWIQVTRCPPTMPISPDCERE